MWIIAATCGDKSESPPVIVPFRRVQGWSAWKCFCELLSEGRGVTVLELDEYSRVGRDFWGKRNSYSVPNIEEMCLIPKK